MLNISLFAGLGKQFTAVCGATGTTAGQEMLYLFADGSTFDNLPAHGYLIFDNASLIGQESDAAITENATGYFAVIGPNLAPSPRIALTFDVLFDKATTLSASSRGNNTSLSCPVAIKTLANGHDIEAVVQSVTATTTWASVLNGFWVPVDFAVNARGEFLDQLGVR